MTSGQQYIESATSGVEALKRALKSSKTLQVQSADEKQLIKATALAWFNNLRTPLAEYFDDAQLKPIDDSYRLLLMAADRSTKRLKYVETIKALRKKLGELLGTL